MLWNRGSGGQVADDELPEDVILSVRDLQVDYGVRRGQVHAVRDVSFDLHKGETLALIGESGSGKTTLALALIRMLVKSATVRSGTVLYRGQEGAYDVLRLGAGPLRRFRWSECALVFQSALNALNPVLRIEDQFRDTAKAHDMRDGRAIRERTRELLGLVQLDADRVMSSYPHELSGGMRQRVLLALGLLLRPQLIILDEPTTALDILTQRTIIDLLRRLKEQLGFAMILVSHDLSLAAELADRVATMYAGRIVEHGDVRQIFYEPHHPYTVGLLRAVPTLSGDFRLLDSVRGSPPDLIDLPPGCAFHPRCPHATDECLAAEPPLLAISADGASLHQAACFHAKAVNDAWQAVLASTKEDDAPPATTPVATTPAMAAATGTNGSAGAALHAGGQR